MSQKADQNIQEPSKTKAFLNNVQKLGQITISDYGSLWVIGLIVLPILVCTQILHLYTYDYQWFEYLAFGTLYPAFFLIISITENLYNKNQKILSWLKISMLMIFVLAVAVYFTIGGFYYTRSGLGFIGLACILAYLQTFIIRKREKARGKPIAKQKNLNNIILLIFAVICWTICLPFIFNQFKIGLNTNLAQLLYILTVIFIMLIFFCFEIAGEEKKQQKKFRFITFSNVIAVVVIIFISFRTDNLFNPVSFHHWGVFIGPAEMVRQGGWLLWNVPSQYGFLSILLLAFFPTQSLWISLYILNGFFNSLVGIIFFYSLRWPFNTFSRFLFALILTLTGVFFRVNVANTYGLFNVKGVEGVDVFPSSGGIRYLWCYVLLLVLIWQFRFREKAALQSKIFLVGNFIWLLSVFWSAESVVYCSAIWLPAYIVIILQRNFKGFLLQTNRPKLIFNTLSWLILPLLLLLVAISLIELVYIFGLGHGPDWKSYLDYAFGTDYFVLLLDESSAIWGFLAIYCFLCIFGLKVLNKGLTNPQLGIYLGIFGMLWSTSSYYITREVPAAFAYVKPFIIITLIAGLFLGQRQYREENWFRLVKLFIIAALTMIVVTSISSLSDFASATNLNQNINLEQRLPRLDENLSHLFDQAQVKPSDPLVYTGDLNLLPAWYYKKNNSSLLVTTMPTWLPIYPDALLHVLPIERRQVYVDRFIKQYRLSGWLVERLGGTVPTEFKFDEPTTWLHQILDNEYKATKSFTSQEWRITWYQLKSY